MYRESDENILLFGAHFLKQREYWSNKLSGHTGKTAFFSPAPITSLQWSRREEVEIVLPEPVCQGLLKISKGIDLSLYVVLLSVLKTLLYRYTARESINRDIVVISPVYQPKITEETLNHYIYLKDSLDGKDTFKQTVLKVRQCVLEGYGNQDYPAEKLVEFLFGSQSTGTSSFSKASLTPDPLADVMCALANIHDSNQTQLEKGNVFFLFSRQDDRVSGRISYEAAIFDRGFFRQAALHFTRILESVLDNMDLALSTIPLLSEEEKKQIMTEFNREPAAACEEKPFLRLFTDQVEKTPDTIALIGPDQHHRQEPGSDPLGSSGKKNPVTRREVQLSYKELNQRANRQAAFLREKGVQPGHSVGLLLERSPALVESILSVWKQRANYVPLDSSNPGERIQYILENSRARLLISETSLVKKYPLTALRGSRQEDAGVEGNEEQEFVREIVTVDEAAGEPTAPPAENPGNPGPSSELAYIIYTSGSTGAPKGAMVEHAGMTNHMAAKIRDLQISAASIAAQNSPHTFDISVWQFFAALACGGRTVIYPDSLVLDPGEFIRRLIRDRVTLLEVVPSYLSALLDHLALSSYSPDTLTALLVTGETIKPALVKRWFELYPHIKMVNVYGPTEASDDITHYFMEKAPQREPVPIGKPIANLRIYILDPDGNLCPVGVPGEIVVSGVGVGRGYIGNEEKTREVFSEDPFCRERGIRMYRTGDLGAWLPDGNIDFYGRKDYQVKIRGYRIELGEIETCLQGIPGTAEAVVVTREEEQGSHCLCAYMVAHPGVTLDIKEVKDLLKERLPGYMVPEYIFQLAELPLTKNGKIHREALPAPGEMQRQDTYQAPRTLLEENMAGTWAEVLGVEKVGIEDNFFEFGGDSIKAIQLSARMQKHGVNIKIGDLFLHPTIKELAQMAQPAGQAVPQEPVAGEVPLLPIQQAFFDSQLTHSHHYNQAVIIFREQGFAEDIVRQAFTRLVQHHDMLRAVFRQDPGTGQVIQHIRGMEEPLFHLVVQHLNNNPAAEIETAANQIQQSINLEQGPLVKIGLFKSTAGDYLLVVIHHLVIEGVSWRILFEDFQTAYQQVQKGEPIVLPDKTDSFKRWAAALREYAQDRALKHLDYWKDLEQTRVDELPCDHPLEPRMKKNKYREQLTVSLEETLTGMLLKQTGQAYGTEASELMITALGLALKEWSGMQRIPLTLEGHGREEIIAEIVITRTVGWFSVEFPVILDLEGVDSIPQAIKTVKEILRRIPNKGIDYGVLRYLTPPEKIAGMSFQLEPQVCFNYIGHIDGQTQQGTDAFFRLSSLAKGRDISPEAQYPSGIVLDADISAGKLNLLWEYNRYEYREQRIEKLMQHYLYYLEAIIRHCAGKKEQELTPADLGYSNLTMDELEDIKSGIRDLV